GAPRAGARRSLRRGIPGRRPPRARGRRPRGRAAARRRRDRRDADLPLHAGRRRARARSRLLRPPARGDPRPPAPGGASPAGAGEALGRAPHLPGGASPVPVATSDIEYRLPLPIFIRILAASRTRPNGTAGFIQTSPSHVVRFFSFVT